MTMVNPPCPLCGQCADDFDDLVHEVERLSTALQEIARHPTDPTRSLSTVMIDLQEIARAALEGG
jgi:predicted dithiol-disulfide oxidoreductase (DUF899 family)